MRARPGDRIVIASATVGATRRDGVVVDVPHPDGSPPYRVRWDDTGTETVFFPGHDASVSHDEGSDGGSDGGAASAAGERPPGQGWEHVRRWTVTVDVFAHEDDTTAHAVLSGFDGTGSAHRQPADAPSAEVGAEVATARALRQLADSLTARAESVVGSRG
ncbi:DUF1918 domain-containing protein [Kineococcus sp. SYSU DK003]|uniref:DUF1918 domain-containing protein n=1 Tax=Kineococcus sp. SYSU DK003 TaxID=3383124 RepID=UPI003D7D2F3F